LLGAGGFLIIVPETESRVAGVVLAAVVIGILWAKGRRAERVQKAAAGSQGR